MESWSSAGPTLADTALLSNVQCAGRQSLENKRQGKGHQIGLSFEENLSVPCNSVQDRLMYAMCEDTGSLSQQFCQNLFL